MRRLRSFFHTLQLPILLYGILACTISLDAQHGAMGQPAHTHVRLVSDVAAATPGGSITVGVLLRIDAGWHIYWSNPGESGLATAVQWKVPPGAVIADLSWPVPVKTIEEGDVLTYGYSNETMLIATLQLPASLFSARELTIKADVSWLECKNTCVPGNASATLVLPVGVGGTPSTDAVAINRYRAALPVPLTAQNEIKTTVTESSDTVALAVAASAPDISLSAATLDFFPSSGNVPSGARTTVTVQGRSAVIHVPVVSRKADSSALRGIVVYTSADGARKGVEIVHQRGGATSLLDREFVTASHTGKDAPLLLYIGFALVGGLLLNVMPCVLPVIALKVFGLVKMAGDEPAKVRRMGWMFSLGILASFLILALLVVLFKIAGQQVGWGFQFQEPVFVIVMSALVFAFGLSLFGVFEIRLPGAAMAGVSAVIAQQEHHPGKGYLSSFGEGVFATILATPCTAPFLGSALGFAFAQPTGTVFLIFSAVAAGMAFPYLLLTARPAWQRFLPKPGAWMETAKQFMGFFMMATLLWLLYILGKQLGMEGVIWTGAFLLVVAIGCWLVGRFATLSASRRTFWVTWGGVAVLLVSGYLVIIDGILDVRAAIAGTPAVTSTTTGQSSTEVVWQPFSLSVLDQQLQSQKPVFVDFTAEWCLTCKVNERTIIADQRVQDKLRASGIFTMKADWTSRNPDITRLLGKFGRSGVPLYVLFPAGHPNEPIVLPEVLTTSILLDALERTAPVH
jgi:thiol:disulfide interchange protein